MLALGAIPQISAGTVPAAEKRVFPRQDVGPTESVAVRRVQQVNIIIIDAGAHATFVATVEGSFDGVAFFNLAQGILNPNVGGLTLDENGVAFSAALGTAGLHLQLEVAFPIYRLGLAGDNAAADGSGKITLKQARG